MDKTIVADTPAVCTFCGKRQHEYRHVIEGPAIFIVDVAGPKVFICDECVDLAADLMKEKRNRPAPADKPAHAANPGD